MAYVSAKAGRNRGPNARAIQSFAAGSPALGTTTAVHAAVTDTGVQQVVTTGITQPDIARNVTATAGGTNTDIKAISVVVAGTDINGTAISETLPAFTVDTAGTVAGVKAFKTVTSITIPAHDGTGATTAIGRGTKIGFPYPLSRDTILRTYLNGVKEATAPTFAGHATDAAQTTAILNSALNGTAVIFDYYES